MGASRLILFFLCLSLSGVAQAQTLRGVVTHVEDGDTLTISIGRDRYPVRLADIDAPETCHRRRDPTCTRPGQPGGEEARAALEELSLGRRAIARCRDTSHDRLVCHVEVDGRDMSMQLAVRGLVWWEERYGTDQRIRAAVDHAKRHRIGLWAKPGAIPPREWRQQCWQLGQCRVGHR